MTKICPKCNKKNADTAKFCQDCGEELPEATSKPSKTGGIGAWWNKQGNGAKIGIIAGICCIGLIAIVALAGMASPDKTTTSTSPTANTTSTNNDTASNSLSSSAEGIQIVVDYSGNWQGSYGDETGQQSVQGSGKKTISVSGNPSIVSAVMQKMDGGSETLTVKILKDGSVKQSKSTSADYGVVTVSYSSF